MIHTCIPGSARPCRSESFGKKTGYQKSMAYCWSCEVHQRMRRWQLNQQRITHNGLNEPMNRRINEATRNWINQPPNHNQWSKEAMNQWNNQGNNAPMNQRTNEPMNGRTMQWINESRNQWVNEPNFIESLNQWNKKRGRTLNDIQWIKRPVN